MVFAASILAIVLGSIHAFSVFLIPLEVRFDAPRGAVSATYSLALVALTTAVFFGHRLFGRWSAGGFVLAIGLIATLGALVAAFAPSLPIVWIGYSLLFGGANGLGYGFGLQIASQANAGREGTAMGVVTAAYALGATISPILFTQAVTYGGFQAAMFGLMAALIGAAVLCAMVLRVSRTVFRSEDHQTPQITVRPGEFLLLWLGYGTGAAAGLMTIGHAAGIASAKGFDGAIWAGPALIAVSNLAGSLIAGRLVDRISAIGMLVGLPVVSMAGVSVLALSSSFGPMLVCFAIVGFSYGGIIAAYPAAIAKTFGVLNSTRIYGRVFTAWGCAGLISPWLAGRLFDWTGTYQIALWTAGALGLVSVCAILGFFAHRPVVTVPVADGVQKA